MVAADLPTVSDVEAATKMLLPLSEGWRLPVANAEVDSEDVAEELEGANDVNNRVSVPTMMPPGIALKVCLAVLIAEPPTDSVVSPTITRLRLFEIGFATIVSDDSTIETSTFGAESACVLAMEANGCVSEPTTTPDGTILTG